MNSTELLKFCAEQPGEAVALPNPLSTVIAPRNECMRIRWNPAEGVSSDAIEQVAAQIRGMHHEGVGPAIVASNATDVVFDLLGEGEGIDFPVSEFNFLAEAVTFLGAPPADAGEMTPRDPEDVRKEAPFEYLMRTLCEPFSSSLGSVAALTSKFSETTYSPTSVVCYRHAKSVQTPDDASRLAAMVRGGSISKRTAANLMAHYCSEKMVDSAVCGSDTAGNPVDVCTRVQAEKVSGARPCTDWLQGMWLGPGDTPFWTPTELYDPDKGDVPAQFKDAFVQKVCDRNPEFAECDCEKASVLPVGCRCSNPVDGRCAYRCAVWRSMAKLNQCGGTVSSGVVASDGPKMCWLPPCQEEIMISSRTVLSRPFACPDICAALASAHGQDRKSMKDVLVSANCGGMETDGVVALAEYRRRRYEEQNMFASSRTATTALETVAEHTAEIMLLVAAVMVFVTFFSVSVASRV